MCGAKEKGNAKSNIHIVSAWCSSDKLVLGQVKTDEKSNEITAIPELLDMLFIKGCIVTTDAMGCQKDIAKKIEEYRTIEKGYGRIEERIYYFSRDINWMDAKDDWRKLNGIGMVIRRCERDGVKTAEDYARGVRLHWGVESMHWSLDVTFREDENRTRKGCAPQNLALLKRLALNMMKKDQDKYPKRSLRKKRFTCSLNTDYLDYILSINLK